MLRLIPKRLKHISPAAKAGLIFIAIGIFSFLFPTPKVPIDVGNVLSATSIFYSILLGFYIAASMTNLSRLKTLVATETGALIAIYRIVVLSLPARAKQTQHAIDIYLIKRFDYEISDYTEPTTNEYFAIFDVLKGAETKSEGQGAAMNYIAEGMYYVAQARRELTIVGARVVTSASWLILDVLSMIIVFSLFLLRDGSWESALVTTFLASAAILALFILDDVDGNRLGEEQFAIDTYQDVFRAIGVLPYYPRLYLEAGRYKPPEKHYRTGSSTKIWEVGTSQGDQ